MRNCFCSKTSIGTCSAGLLVLRLVMGTAFMIHGWGKIQSPSGWMGWMGPDASVPAILQGLAALTEFGGGIALIVGLLTRLASLGIGIVMVVAITTVHAAMGQPFVSKMGGPSFELPAVYLACAVLFLLSGAGRLSLDALLFGRWCGTKPPATE
jgi:putative oxidoreductase